MDLELSKWQKTWMDHFDDDLYMACTSIGAGKTRILATWLVLQCLKKPGIRGIVVAQTHDALRNVLIHDIIMFSTQIGIELDYNKSRQILTFPGGSVLYGFSSEHPEAVLGLSEIDILAIDEAAYCSEEIYNYSRDRMRGGKYHTMVRLISSPSTLGRVANWFSEIVKSHPDKVIHATYRDNPFTKEEFKKELEERYVIGTNLFRQQCLGEIFDTDIASQIIFRNEFPKEKRGSDELRYFGFDASGLGADEDVMVVVDKYGVVKYERMREADTHQKANIASNLFDTYRFKSGCADGTGGYSLGTVDLLKAKNIVITPVNFAQAAFNDTMYPNARTEMYLELAREVRNGFWVPDEARDELLAQEVTINRKGMQALAPKELVKKQIGHSPDLVDAIALAVYAMNHHGGAQSMTAEQAQRVADKYLSLFERFN